VQRELDAEYIVSAVEIRDHEQLWLACERRFESDDSVGQIFPRSPVKEPSGPC
jgi:hypothetical protein